MHRSEKPTLVWSIYSISENYSALPLCRLINVNENHIDRARLNAGLFKIKFVLSSKNVNSWVQCWLHVDEKKWINWLYRCLVMYFMFIKFMHQQFYCLCSSCTSNNQEHMSERFIRLYSVDNVSSHYLCTNCFSKSCFIK